MLRAIVTLGVAIGFLATAVVARAEVESERVRAGLQAFQRLEYERSVALLEQALSESLTRDEKVAVFRTLGFCHVALEKPDEARRDFVRLLAIDSGLGLDRRVSPRVRAAFEAARAELAQRGPGELRAYRLPELTPRLRPAAPREGEPLAIEVEHPGGLARRAELFHRVRGAAVYGRMETMVDVRGLARFSLPGSAVRAPALEHYLQLLDESGVAIARAGGLAAPLAVGVAARPVPVWRRGWFWGVMGGVAAVLVAGGVATAVALGAPAKVTIQPQ